MALRVLIPGALSTVQDLGRAGYERFGVSRSGAMDAFALRAANRLVANAASAAAVEFVLDAPVFQAEADCIAACTGFGWAMEVQGRSVGSWRAALVRRGEMVRFLPESGLAAGWGYFAVGGGISTPPVMGSRATDLRAGLGGLEGRALREGDVLPVAPAPLDLQIAGRWLPPHWRPAYGTAVTVPAIPGPQEAIFSVLSYAEFWETSWQISPTSDRMGCRLIGSPLERVSQAELLSEGIAPGSVQVPPDGQPIVLMADRPTTGGYPKIATVAQCGLPLIAQAMPGRGRVRFEVVTVEEAQARWRGLIRGLETGVEDDGEDPAY